MTVVLDASALLAYLRQEPGGKVVDGVDGVLAESVIGNVNWAEVDQKLIPPGWRWRGCWRICKPWG